MYVCGRAGACMFMYVRARVINLFWHSVCMFCIPYEPAHCIVQLLEGLYLVKGENNGSQETEREKNKMNSDKEIKNIHSSAMRGNCPG